MIKIKCNLNKFKSRSKKVSPFDKFWTFVRNELNIPKEKKITVFNVTLSKNDYEELKKMNLNWHLKHKGNKTKEAILEELSMLELGYYPACDDNVSVGTIEFN